MDSHIHRVSAVGQILELDALYHAPIATVEARDDTSATITRPPSEYLRQIWLGSMVFYPPTLEFVIRSVGVDHVCLGSDYPYDMADPDPAGTVEKVVSLSEPELNAVLEGNAKVLFDLHR